MKNIWIERVCGRVQEDVSGAPDEAIPASGASPIPEPERQSRIDYDEQTGQLPASGAAPDESVVDNLISAWHNGQRSEVAAQILFTPVSYADFARFVYALGPDEAVELGVMIDELSASEGIGPDTAHQRALDRVSGGRAEPTGAEPPMPETGEELPVPPTDEPEVEPQ